MSFILVGAALLAWLGRLLLNRASVRASGARVVGHLCEIGVYRDVPGQIWQCLLRLCRAALELARQLVVPCLLWAFPCLFVVIALRARESLRPLLPGETCLLSVQLSPGQQGQVTLELPTGVVQDSPPLLIAQRHQIFWRLRPTEPGRYTLTLTLAGSTLTKTLLVGPPPAMIGEARTQVWWGALLNPGERNLSPGAWAQEIRLDYPPREFWLGDHRLSWLGVFLLALGGFGLLSEIGRIVCLL